MLHPAYSEIVEKVNDHADKNGFRRVDSRYTVVAMAYRRAHQIILGDRRDPDDNVKPLSQAIDEIYNNEVNILKED